MQWTPKSPHAETLDLKHFMKLFRVLSQQIGILCLPRYSLHSPHLTCLHFAKLLPELQVFANSIKAKNQLHQPNAPSPCEDSSRLAFNLCKLIQWFQGITYRPLPYHGLSWCVLNYVRPSCDCMTSLGTYKHTALCTPHPPLSLAAFRLISECIHV